MQRIPIPVVSYSDIENTLSGVRYLLGYRFNGRDNRWRVDIKDSDNIYVVKGLKLLEGVSPTAHLSSINFQDGLLQVVEINADDSPAGRNNLGIDKSYEFIYVSFAEIEG